MHSVLRLRGELQKLLDTQASRLTDTKRQSAYLSTHYEDLLKLVRVRSSASAFAFRALTIA